MVAVMAVSLERHGNAANVQWRAISMECLRAHPLYQALPPPEDVHPTSLKSLGMYRQDSWQWSALHSGRLTTSKLASCLGFYEAFPSATLEIPRSLQSHSRVVAAWQQLLLRSVSNFSELEESVTTPVGVAKPFLPPHLWVEYELAHHPFTHCLEESGPATSMSLSSERKMAYTSASAARLAWGSAQEATAILACLNHFAKSEPGTVADEAGMFTLEALQEDFAHKQYLDQQRALRDILGGPSTPPLPPAPIQPTAAPRWQKRSKPAPRAISRECLYEDVQRCITERSLPLLGASPDGVLRHSDGRVEALEVKCVSPFVDITAKQQPPETAESPPDGGVAPSGMKVVGGFGPTQRAGKRIKAGFGVWHVPQLQLEMFCIGAHCRSAVMVVLSVSGVRLFRVQRDDEYIAAMLELVRQFYTQFVSSVPSNRRKPPLPNFFNPRTDPSYASFLQRTVALAEGAELLVELQGDAVQRSAQNSEFFFDG